jgi:hypothetical protein
MTSRNFLSFLTFILLNLADFSTKAQESSWQNFPSLLRPWRHLWTTTKRAKFCLWNSVITNCFWPAIFVCYNKSSLIRVNLCTKMIILLKIMFVITECLLTIEFVINEFHCISKLQNLDSSSQQVCTGLLFDVLAHRNCHQIFNRCGISRRKLGSSFLIFGFAQCVQIVP